MSDWQFKDEGFEETILSLDMISRLSLDIGFVGSAANEIYPGTTLNVATVALWQEFGTEYIPARSFLRSTFIEKRNVIFDIWSDGLSDIIMRDKDPLQVYSQMGQRISGLVLDKLDRANGWAKALDEATVEAKGSNKPLIDTGLLRRSLGWAVYENQTIKAQGKAIG